MAAQAQRPFVIEDLRKVERFLKRESAQVRERVEELLVEIANNPFPRRIAGSVTIIPLKGKYKGFFRLAAPIQGNDIRIRYAVNPQVRRVGYCRDRLAWKHKLLASICVPVACQLTQ